MKMTIDTGVLQREGLSLGDFLALLMGFYGVKYKECVDKLTGMGLAQLNVFDKVSLVLSDNSRNYVASLLMRSDDKVTGSNINFLRLARQLQDIYPQGNKPGTLFSWTDDERVIEQKLITLVARYDFTFTEEEAIKATQEYVSSFGEDRQKMSVLKNFILNTKVNEQLIDSMFMTIIENNR